MAGWIVAAALASVAAFLFLAMKRAMLEAFAVSSLLAKVLLDERAASVERASLLEEVAKLRPREPALMAGDASKRLCERALSQFRAGGIVSTGAVWGAWKDWEARHVDRGMSPGPRP